MYVVEVCFFLFVFRFGTIKNWLRKGVLIQNRSAVLHTIVIYEFHMREWKMSDFSP